jgi:hypothetical protein
MKTTYKFLAPVLAFSAMLIATDIYAQRGGGGGGGRGGGSGASGGGRSGGGSGYNGGGHRGGSGHHGGGRHGGGHHGGRHGGHHGHGHHGHGHHGHGHGWYGGYYGGYYGWPAYAYWGWPLAWGAAWGWPYYDYYYPYPQETLVYRESVPYPVYPEGAIAPAPSAPVPRGNGAPTQGPLYQNYCESAKGYFPQVTSCPEGWRLVVPQG